MNKYLSIVIIIGLLTGCLRHGPEKLNTIDLRGKEFTQELARQYADFAKSEVGGHDWHSSNHFADKALRASKGIRVDPEHPEDWNIPESLLPTLKKARRVLLDTIDSDAIKFSTKASARAFFLYDCWVEELEEEWQAASIESCRQELFEVLDFLSERKGPMKVTKVEVSDIKKDESLEESDSSYTIFFDTNSYEIDEDGMMVIKKIAKTLKEYESYEIVLNGHTDTLGTARDNLKLSIKMASAIRSEMVKNGLNKKSIDIFGFGQTDLKEQTSDEISNRANRRVEIFIQ